MPGLRQLWMQEDFQRSLVNALRGWNSALHAGWPEQLRAAGQMKQIFGRYTSAMAMESHEPGAKLQVSFHRGAGQATLGKLGSVPAASHAGTKPAASEYPASAHAASADATAGHAASEHSTMAHAASSETPAQTLDRLLDFPSHRLAVYGSLAPGKKNHHVIAGISGSWRKATLRGSLLNEGWGAGEGFPGFLWEGNTPIAAQVFSSADLPHYWTMLDEFEGEEYRRILVPAEIHRIGKDDAGKDGAAIEICNVYALARSG